MNLNYVCFYVLTFWKHAVIKLSGKRFLEGKINDIIKNKYLKNDNGLDKNGIPLCVYLWLVNKSFTWSCLQTVACFYVRVNGGNIVRTRNLDIFPYVKSKVVEKYADTFYFSLKRMVIL